MATTPHLAQLVSTIAPSAPATRRPARGDEPFMRPEIGFTPAWFRQHHARRAIMYTPMDLVNKSTAALRADFERIARDYAPCDIVLADIEAGTPDERVRLAIDLCAELTSRTERKP